MPLLARNIHVPLVIDIKTEAVATLASMLTDRRISVDGHVAVTVGPGIGREVSDIVRNNLDHADILTVTGGSLDTAIELGEKLRAGNYDAVVAIGGGK